MGVFTPTKPKITEKEIKDIGNDLENVHGFTPPQRQLVVDVLLKPHVESSPYESTPSISREEAVKIKESLNNKSGGVYKTLKEKNLTDAEIEDLEKEIDKALITNR